MHSYSNTKLGTMEAHMKIFTLLLASLLSGCFQQSSNQICIHNTDAAEMTALETEFQSMSIKFQIREDGSFCYSRDKQFEASQIESRINQYRMRAAIKVSDPSIEGILLRWLKQENKSYQASPIPGDGTFYIVYSVSPEDSDRNIEAIRQIEGGVMPSRDIFGQSKKKP